MDTIVVILSYSLMALGLIGTVLPMIPGLILILAGMIIYSWHAGFEILGLDFILTMVLLAIAGTGIDILTSAVGAKKFGASQLGTVAVVVGMIFGIFTMGPFGLIIGPIVAVTVTEMIRGKNFKQALSVLLGVLLGLLSGIAIRVIIGIAMIVAFTIKIIA